MLCFIVKGSKWSTTSDDKESGMNRGLEGAIESDHLAVAYVGSEVFRSLCPR